MITTFLDLVDPSAFKHFNIVVINAAVDAIKRLELDDRFDILFVRIIRAPGDPDTATFISHIHQNADTGGTYIGNVRFSIGEQRLAVFEAKPNCLLKRRNAIKRRL